MDFMNFSYDKVNSCPYCKFLLLFRHQFLWRWVSPHEFKRGMSSENQKYDKKTLRKCLNLEFLSNSRFTRSFTQFLSYQIILIHMNFL